MSKGETGSRSFGAFSGVFIPTFLSIVGVILFLRLGYVVGGAGLLGTITIILLAISVTLATGLALSSIASNIRIGAGGAYSIISKTLGLEIGGSIGIPLYLAQTFSVALYIFGFSEAWKFLFPSHNITIVALAAFSLLFLLTFLSTKGAVKVQVGVFVLICIALTVVFLGGNIPQGSPSVPMRNLQGPGFWTLFAIFFPAVTGLMAGIGMSGELSDPKRQIPKGILYGLGTTTVIYLATAVLLAYSSTTGQLLSNKLIIAEVSALPQLVLVGILAATFSSALTVLIAAPRVLQALSDNSIIPKSHLFTKKSEEREEPRNAILATGAIIVPLLIIGNLNSIAQVLTMFFLITYAVINVAVFIEQSLSLRSFRPLFKTPKIVPLYGALASFAMMFLINPYASVIAMFSIFAIYGLLLQKPLKQEKGDVRSGLFRAVSQWAAEKTRTLPESSMHIWKPNLLVPVLTTKTLTGNFPLIKSIAYPHGRMTTLGFKLRESIDENPEEEDITEEQIEKELEELPDLVDKFSKEKIFTSYSTIDAEDYTNALIVSMEAIESQVFSPNILFLPYRPNKLHKNDLNRIVKASEEKRCGVTLFDRDNEIGLGTEQDVHVWISPKALKEDLFEERYYDLALLMAYSIKKKWNGTMHLWMCVDEDKEKDAHRYLSKLSYEARLPRSTEINVMTGEFIETLEEAPKGDIHVIPFEENDVQTILNIAETEGRSFLFVLDSTRESVLA